MTAMRVTGVFSVIPATMLLTVSFFVLLALRKIDKDQGFKVFGYVVAALLWVSTAIVAGTGIYTMATGKHPMKQMMQHKMMGHVDMMDKDMPMMKQEMMKR